MFYPLINCGLHAGETPKCWEGEKFNTEEECQEWIDEMADLGEFTESELGGCIYPCEVES